MAEQPARSDSSPETDRDFDPSADMLVNDYDDEQTLDEEEALSNEGSCSNELSDLQKEGDMPLEELLAMYGYGGGVPVQPAPELHDARSSSEEEILSNQDLTLDKDEIARDLMLKDDEHDKETSVNELLDIVDMPSQTVRLLRSNHASSDEESEDDDYVPDDDWKKTISVGSDFQAPIPEGLSKYGDAPAYENEDRLLWDPFKLEDKHAEKYLSEVHRQIHQIGQGVQAIPTGIHTRDDEQALYLLLQCGHNVEEALRRRKMQAVPPTDPMSLWSEEECRNFENGLRTYGKDFYLIQQNKVRTRSVGELVQFYYLWKKTERHDVFANKTRLEKKKYILHPGVTDYMDRFLDEQENPPPIRDRSASPITSLIYCDPKRQQALAAAAAAASAAAASSASANSDPSPADIAAALQMVQEVVDPDKVFNNMKLNSEQNTSSVLPRSEMKEKQLVIDSQTLTSNAASRSGTTSFDISSRREVAIPNKYSNLVEPPVKRSKIERKDKEVSSSDVVHCIGAALPSEKQAQDKQKTTNGNGETPHSHNDFEKRIERLKDTESSLTGTAPSSVEKDGVTSTNCELKKELETVVK